MPPFSMSFNPDPKMLDFAKKFKKIVGQHYTILESMFDDHGYYYTIILDKKTHTEKFEKLRLDLKKSNHFPKLFKKEGEWVIAVFPYPERSHYTLKVNITLLIITIFTTFWAGAYLWSGYWGDDTGYFSVLLNSRAFLWGGITFGIPLMAILGTHEMGHYLLSKKHNVEASLPFFIPIPPFIGPFGTFGALISMRENMPNRRALVEIGAAGPIAGFAVALPVIYIGLYLSNIHPSTAEMVGEGIIIHFPLIFSLFQGIIPIAPNTPLHPTAIAGWIGVLVTALNLLPMGQLDGGHIVRGVFGDGAKYISFGFIILVIILAFQYNFFSYLLFVFLILFLGPVHPPPLDDFSPLNRRQRLVAVSALLLFLLSFHPNPLSLVNIEEPKYDIAMHYESNVTYLLPGEMEEAYLKIVNTGNRDEVISTSVKAIHIPKTSNDTWQKINASHPWDYNGFILNLTDGDGESEISPEKSIIISIKATAPKIPHFGWGALVEVNATLLRENRSFLKRFWFIISPLKVHMEKKEIKIIPGNGARTSVDVKNVLRSNVNVNVTLTSRYINASVHPDNFLLNEGEEKEIIITVFTSDEWNEETSIKVLLTGSDKEILGIFYIKLLPVATNGL